MDSEFAIQSQKFNFFLKHEKQNNLTDMIEFERIVERLESKDLGNKVEREVPIPNNLENATSYLSTLEIIMADPQNHVEKIREDIKQNFLKNIDLL